MLLRLATATARTGRGSVVECDQCGMAESGVSPKRRDIVCLVGRLVESRILQLLKLEL